MLTLNDIVLQHISVRWHASAKPKMAPYKAIVQGLLLHNLMLMHLSVSVFLQEFKMDIIIQCRLFVA